MSQRFGDDGETPLVGSVEDLVDYFRAGEKPTDAFRIGTEHEKIGVYEKDSTRVPYEGERGIGALLDRIADADGWTRVREGSHTVALRKDGASITLEPGGQMELSGAPLPFLRDTCSEFNTHVDLVNRVSDEFGIAWLALGADPLHDVASIPVVPKERYDIMRSYLPSRGGHALHMMLGTATVQANFDYRDEADMADKMRTALGCTAIVSAIFANSPLSGGVENGFVSCRNAIWSDVDPDRCGMIPFVFEEDFGYRDYVEWALDVPMFFVLRGGRHLPARGLTFREFAKNGYAEHRATVSDWDLHLTTVFPEVRLKRFIEVRGADAVPRDMTCALPALWKGILYDDDARAAARDLVRRWSAEHRQDALAQVARHGLAARTAGRPVLDLARELTRISTEGLGRIARATDAPGDERSFLDPVRAQLELGKSPGQVILERWRGEWDRNPERLIESVRY